MRFAWADPLVSLCPLVKLQRLLALEETPPHTDLHPLPIPVQSTFDLLAFLPLKISILGLWGQQGGERHPLPSLSSEIAVHF